MEEKAKDSEEILRNLAISDLNTTKNLLKKKINFEQNIEWKKTIEHERNKQSKLDFLINNTKRDVTTRPKYMEKMYLKDAKNILKYRTRMMSVKCNFKSKYNNHTCRWCKLEDETQKHILEDCCEFPIERNSINEEDIFDENTQNLRKISKLLEAINKELENK